METLITQTIRKVSHGFGLDRYIEVQQLKDNQWQTTGTFHEADDRMQTKMDNHIERLRNTAC